MSADGARKLFVGGLAETATEVELREVFDTAGFQVEHLALPRDRETGRLRGFAFITLATEEEANRARTELQGKDCCGRPLSIREFSQEGPKRGGPTERPPRQEEPTVFLGKLPFEATQQDIQELFVSEGVGAAARLTLPLGPDGRPRGFGFATLNSQEQADLAVERLNGATLRGRQIVVNPAQPRGAPGTQGPRDAGPRRPAPGPGGGRFSDRPGPSEGFGGGYDSFERAPMEPPMFPPPEGRGDRRRNEGGRKEKPEKRRGGAGGRGGASGSGGGDAGGGEARGGGRKKRGGGGNWHQWERDDD